MEPRDYPDFDDLPKVEGQLQGCAWGVFDKDGKKDVFGTLNFLTPKVIAAAGAEVRDGISISLNWPLNGIKFPFPHRKAPIHRPQTLRELGMPLDGWDDELEINTQFSSQWDSLCHVTDPSGVTYNGATPTKEGLSVQSTADSDLPTIDQWHVRGGVVGRGVLIDFKNWWEETKGEKFDPLDGYKITVADIETVAAFENVEFREGDVLVVRTGYTEVLGAPTPGDFEKMARATLSGVHGVEETVRWVWNKRISAVAGDAHAFEALPAVGAEGKEAGGGLVLHPYFLNLFGMPIGELWDLKELGAYAKKTGRYSFLLTSAPLNHPGLVASPPNAIAIF